MTSPSGDQFLIRSGDHEAVIVEVGGGLRTYDVAGVAVLDGYGAADLISGGRGQILAPWPNRVGGGRYVWEGVARQLALTEPAAGNAIHGLVRWATWTGHPAATDRVVMTVRLHPQPGWAWTMALSAEYHVGPAGLTVTVAATNESDSPCPWGVGFHPYLHAFGGFVDDADLTVPASHVYQSDARGLPVGSGPVEGTEFDFRGGRRIGGQVLDTAFGDLERDDAGRAVVELRSANGSAPRKLWMDSSFTHVMVFSGDTLEPGARRRGLAVEPMTAPPDMLRSGDGLRVLAPGERVESSWGVVPG